MDNTKCIICGKDIPEHRLQQGKQTCCRGCQFKTPEYRQKRSELFKKSWADEDKRKKQSETLKKAYENPEMRQMQSNAVKKHWTKENRQKQSERLKQAYENPEYKQKISESSKAMWSSEGFKEKMSQVQKNTWSDSSKKQEMSNKLCQVHQNRPELRRQHSSCIRELWSTETYKSKVKLGVKQAYDERGPEVQQKRYETMKRNKSYRHSAPEDASYELLIQKYPDTIRQYFDKERYPFKADFYIPSLDLFIECHYSEFHQFEPFNPDNAEHQQRLQELRNKALQKQGKSRYDKMIYTWTDLDVRKRQCAIDNKLNWLAFYSIDDVENFLKSF